MLITYKATLLEKKEIAPEIILLKFSYPDNFDWSYKPGQYMIYHIPAMEKGHPARRLYSISSSPLQRASIDFIIELIPNGIGSNYVKDLNIGDETTLQGPAGLFTYNESDRDSVFLATGTGIAPIYSIIYTILTNQNETNNPKNLQLFWGMKYAKDLYLVEELKKLAEIHKNFKFTICLSREDDVLDESCIKGRVTHGLENESTDIRNKDFYICGGPNVVEGLKTYLQEKNVSKDQVHFEKFT